MFCAQSRWEKLTPSERDFADNWIAQQFAEKNDTLRHLSEKVPSGIAIVDRPPLDPLAFTDRSDWPQKPNKLLDTLSPPRRWKIQEGLLIVFTGDTEELAARVRATGREEYTAEKLRKMQEVLLEITQGKRVSCTSTHATSTFEM